VPERAGMMMPVGHDGEPHRHETFLRRAMK